MVRNEDLRDLIDIDEETEDGGQHAVIASTDGHIKTPRRNFLQRARRDLSEDELSSPAARRFLIAEIERLDEESSRLEAFREKFHQKDKEAESLSQQLKKDNVINTLTTFCLAIGSAGIGAAQTYIPTSSSGYIILALSSILLIVGIFPRFVTKILVRGE